MVNLGPHTKDIPASLKAYCDEVGLPLFTIPWETRMVDMTRDFCHRIMNSHNKENNLSTTIKNIIFKVGDFDTQVQQMERYGFQRSSRFCFVSIAIGGTNSATTEEQKDMLELISEKLAKSMHELYISFSYKDSLILVLVNYSDSEIETFVQSLIGQVKRDMAGWTLHMGISSNKMGIYKQSRNFEKASSAMEVAKTLGETFCYYDKLGIYKILYAVNDKGILNSFYDETIGKLEQYDKENQTSYTKLLWAYLENNASLQITSENLYIHRNTVTNQLNKIKSIVGYDPFCMEDRVNLYMGFYIKTIL